MRVIAGKSKSIKLNTPKGINTRPTSDRIKETLFNIINPYIYDGKFLDLFAGSGAIGIEAASRGARKVILVDNDFSSIKCIKENIKNTRLEDKCEVIVGSSIGIINKLEDRNDKFDIIFLDPPYNKGLEEETIIRLSKSNIIHEDTIIIVEISSNATFKYIEDSGFYIFKSKEYKTSKHVFLKKNINNS